MTSSTPCTADDCERRAASRGLCRAHYQRVLRAEKRDAPKPTKKAAPKPVIFEAVWPIIDPGMPRDELVAEALGDIRAVAARAGVRLTGKATFAIRPGRTQPGSQGAAHCLVAHCPGEPSARTYRKAVAA